MEKKRLEEYFGNIAIDENGEKIEGIVIDLENTPEELITGDGMGDENEEDI